MKTYSGLLLAVLSLSLLTGCTDSILTPKNHATLRQIKKYEIHRDITNADEQAKLFHEMIMYSAIHTAKKAHKKGDNRPISLAMGYHASEKDATLFGVTCNEPVETIKVVFGCVPPPIVYFKLMLEYNKTLLEQPEFPHKNICSIDEKVFQMLSAKDDSWESAGKKE